ncbi:MAG: hypothetical protein JSV49_09075 [Thermoplasmata archaeon]|nr:MAG: hypothetical protein JSV49_09075 [Thermoplasmata archaeon]
MSEKEFKKHKNLRSFIIALILVIIIVLYSFFFITRETESDKWHQKLAVVIINDTNETINGTILLLDKNDRIIVDERFSINKVGELNHEEIFEKKLSEGEYQVKIYIDSNRQYQGTIEKTELHDRYGYTVKDDRIEPW